MPKIFNHNKLRRTLKSKGITQTALANESGMNIATISKLATGKQKNPTPETVTAIATALGVDSETLWTEKTDAPRKTTPDYPEITNPEVAYAVFQRIGDITLSDGSILLKNHNGAIYVAKELGQ